MLQVLQPKQMDPGARKKIRLIKSMEPEWGHLGIFLKFCDHPGNPWSQKPDSFEGPDAVISNFLCVCRGNLELAPNWSMSKHHDIHARIHTYISNVGRSPKHMLL